MSPEGERGFHQPTSDIAHMNHRNRFRLSKLSVALVVAFAAMPALAQNTTSALGGHISGSDGKPVIGADVAIMHTPSGTVSHVSTDAGGRYIARGLRVGGPYTVTISKDGKSDTEKDVFLQLAETQTVDAQLDIGIASKSATNLKAIEVTGTRLPHDGSYDGVLCIEGTWPSIARTIYGDHQRFVNTYFKPYPGYYFTGDGCRRDADGYWWITGRVDDVINVSGHRMGTAEVESALVAHPACAEAAVVGYPHEIKGQGIFAYVILKNGYQESPELIKGLREEVRKIIGPIATPDKILVTPGLPKTRSGKIMRRILRKVAAQETDNLGDISTLADPSVVEALIDKRKKLGA